jgi:hypothetical protein
MHLENPSYIILVMPGVTEVEGMLSNNIKQEINKVMQLVSTVRHGISNTISLR